MRSFPVLAPTLSLLSLMGMQQAVFVSADDRPNVIVIYTDDHGYADLSCQGVFDDVRTPHVDALAASGVRALHGYSTAPQCVPSRAGLLIGKFQARFGLESNGGSLEGFNKELTIAERLQAAGYRTAQFGKWHLGTGPKITDHGFDHVFNQNAGRPFAANITIDGANRPMSQLKPEMYHVDACSRAAAGIIERYKDDPFFLYIAYRAPHVPLDAPPEYLKRFPGKMPERRRQALAMLSAVDDGVGLITQTLAKHDLTQKTLVFYIGDNGAPLKIHKLDAPGGGPGWDGSLNDPLNGEKGMLSEGGMHTPFVVSWPGKIPAGQEYVHPISALDVAATASAIANIKTKPGDFDGVNLIPFLSGQNKTAPHERLMWRWISQSAIREGRWKLLRGGSREYLYDLDTDLEEKHNLAASNPEVAARLRNTLSNWADELNPPGLAKEMSSAGGAWDRYFDFYLDGKPAPPLEEKFRSKSNKPSTQSSGLWIIRSGNMKQTKDGLSITSGRSGRSSPFITRNSLKLRAPVTLKAVVKTQKAGSVALSWRTSKDKDFPAAQKVPASVEASEEWQTVESTIPGEGTVIHVRLHLPKGPTEIQSLELQDANRKSVTLPK